MLQHRTSKRKPTPSDLGRSSLRGAPRPFPPFGARPGRPSSKTNCTRASVRVEGAGPWRAEGARGVSRRVIPHPRHSRSVPNDRAEKTRTQGRSHRFEEEFIGFVNNMICFFNSESPAELIYNGFQTHNTVRNVLVGGLPIVVVLDE